MRFIVYRDKKNQHRWRLVAENEKTIATSGGDGYQNRGDCLAAIALVQSTTDATPIQDGVSKAASRVHRPAGVETKP